MRPATVFILLVSTLVEDRVVRGKLARIFNESWIFSIPKWRGTVVVVAARRRSAHHGRAPFCIITPAPRVTSDARIRRSAHGTFPTCSTALSEKMASWPPGLVSCRRAGADAVEARMAMIVRWPPPGSRRHPLAAGRCRVRPRPRPWGRRAAGRYESGGARAFIPTLCLSKSGAHRSYNDDRRTVSFSHR